MTPTVSQITAMRATVESFLPSACSIARGAATPNARGRIDEPVPVATGVACRAYPRTRSGVSLAEIGGAVKADAAWEVVMPWDTDVEPGDVVTVDTGLVLDVQAVNAGQSIQLSKRCLAVKVA